MKQKELAWMKPGYDAIVVIGQPPVLPLADEPHSMAATVLTVYLLVQSVGCLTLDRPDEWIRRAE